MDGRRPGTGPIYSDPNGGLLILLEGLVKMVINTSCMHVGSIQLLYPNYSVI